jgi:hypothetical protein
MSHVAVTGKRALRIDRVIELWPEVEQIVELTDSSEMPGRASRLCCKRGIGGQGLQ